VALGTCVVIVNWNGRELLKKCLNSLFANTSDTSCRVVVVDNASLDGSADMVEQSYPQVKLFRNANNVGFSKANNIGIRYSLQNGAKYVMLLNNDVEVTDKNWLEEFTGVMESHSKIGIVGCKLVFPDGTLQHAGGLVKLRVPYHRGECEKDNGQYDHVELVDYVTGAALMIKAEAIRKIGLIDEGFSPLYYEDTDWCVRAHLYGYGIAYTPKPTLIHHCGASSNKLGSERKKFYAKRSFIRFVLLNYPVADILKRTLLFESREAIRCLIVKPKRGPLPLALRSDAASRIVVFLRPWLANVHNLKEILYLRHQRYSYVGKLRV
jgi:GT2 family glycosyltransferase